MYKRQRKNGAMEREERQMRGGKNGITCMTFLIIHSMYAWKKLSPAGRDNTSRQRWVVWYTNIKYMRSSSSAIEHEHKRWYMTESIMTTRSEK